jgi:hypothetical protein
VALGLSSVNKFVVASVSGSQIIRAALIAAFFISCPTIQTSYRANPPAGITAARPKIWKEDCVSITMLVIMDPGQQSDLPDLGN